MSRKQKEPQDDSCSEEGGSESSSSSLAEIVILGVTTAKNKDAPVCVRIAGSHGPDLFLVCIDEIGLAQAAGSPAGDSGESVLIGGGRAFQVGVRWTDDEDDDDDFKEWKTVSDLSNGKKFCDEDGDLDPDTAGVPSDVWQMAYGKIVTPLPREEEDSEAEDNDTSN